MGLRKVTGMPSHGGRPRNPERNRWKALAEEAKKKENWFVTFAVEEAENVTPAQAAAVAKRLRKHGLDVEVETHEHQVPNHATGDVETVETASVFVSYTPSAAERAET